MIPIFASRITLHHFARSEGVADTMGVVTPSYTDSGTAIASMYPIDATVDRDSSGNTERNLFTVIIPNYTGIKVNDMLGTSATAMEYQVTSVKQYRGECQLIVEEVDG